MSLNDKFLQTLQDNQLVTLAVASLAIVGALSLSSKILSFLKLIFDVYVRPGKNLKNFGAGRGAWAVITGASDGIGKEFALQLAAAKFNILLISRTMSKLQELSEEIEKRYQVDTKLYAMDFCKGDPKDYEKIKEIISTIEVGVLINNVGTNHEIPTPFNLETDEIVHNIVELQRSNKGLILNIGSFSGMMGTPYLSVYSGSKAFMNTWSQAIGAELKSKGIVVEHVNTYFVVSAMSKIRRASYLIPLPKPYVKSILTKIGVPGGASWVPFSSINYPPHAFFSWFLTNSFSWSFWVNKALAQQEDIRKRALRKREREAAAAKSQ
ncbi:6478_t:CDS:2 [Diversispora eburnea]|uniref:Very-long-chain 3-oxoacyl-CoA reductase n=1 Tax=Diversispora eburnea TaxID=1213867 RepID=A0A9N8V1C1_9GLOM|nr:6478_t:CDS:2 [Diversispora eburnea]